MVKKLVVFFLMGFLLSNLVGCSGGSYKISIGQIDSYQNKLSGKYLCFSGYYFKKVKLDDGEILTVTFSARTEKGKLIAKVLDSFGKTVKTLRTGDSFELSKPGHYKMQVEGKKHKGNFTLAWEEKSPH